LDVRIFKSLGKYPELDSFLEHEFSFTMSYDIADVVIIDDPSKSAKDKLCILISDECRGDMLCLCPSIGYHAVSASINLAVRSYLVSPAAVKIRELQERNALLTEANQGLVELYNLIESKNSQIQFLKNKLENIINSAGESIVEMDENGGILFVNNKFIEVTGYSKEQSEYMNFILLLEENNRKEFYSAFKALTSDKMKEVKTRLKCRNGDYIDIHGYMTVIKGADINYELIFQDISKKLKLERQMKLLEEKAIVSGFSRHLSHNILNALTISGGFLKKIKESADKSDIMKHRWLIVEDKFKLIEEIVIGYNDYTNVIGLKYTENLDIAAHMHETIESIANKDFDRTFSAFLYNFTDLYEMEYDFRFKGTCRMEANKNYLKLGFCYIIKDIIRYFAEDQPMKFRVITDIYEGRFGVGIYILNLDVPQPVLDTMCQPWNHNMLAQSFDYWGIVIASIVIEKHDGKLSIEKQNGGIKIMILF
jgi:PAS domain S-box-containing protein